MSQVTSERIGPHAQAFVDTAARSTDIGVWLARHPEFDAAAHRMARLYQREARCALAFGAYALRTLKHYDRQLNAAKLALALSQVTQRRFTREVINDYRNAYRMYAALKRECGGRPPQLEVTKLAKAWQAGKGQLADHEKVELCRRAAARNLTRAQMTDEALRIVKERSRTSVAWTVVVQQQAVRLVDGLDLLRQIVPATAVLVVLDYMYKPYGGTSYGGLPPVHVPEDPGAHLVECIPAARAALAPDGAIALFTDHAGTSRCSPVGV